MTRILDIISPFDRQPVAQVAMHSANDAHQMLDDAVAAFAKRATGPNKTARGEILKKVAVAMEKEAEALALTIAREGGKPLTDAKVEVVRAIDGIYLAIEEMAAMGPEEVPMGRTEASRGREAYTVPEPIGVVVAISAFNHPLNLIVHQVIPAIAVGCPVIIKPDLKTPLSCLHLVALLHAAGLPKDWCQACLCNNDVAERLATDGRIGFVAFIGSAKVGWALRSKLAAGVRCSLEHGGVAPVIVDDTIDIDAVAAPLTKGAFYHAGQVCVSVQRVYAPVAVARKLAGALAERAKALVVGDPTLPQTEVGPLITPAEVVRVDEWVQEAVESGAELLCGGQALGETCYAPTVLFEPADTVRVSRQEVFGPVVCVYGYSDVADALARANRLDYAFQAAVFSKDSQWALDVAARLDASAVMINDHTAFRVDWMPFGGRRHSGLGLSGIGYTMAEMTARKLVVVRS